jgi:hypothetical protein
MRRSLVVLVLAAASVAVAVAADRIIEVDDAHSQMQASSGTKPPLYAVPLGSSIVVEASHYKFKYPPSWLPGPVNSIQLVLANDQQFSAAWNAGTPRLELSESTLKANPGSKPFAGFHTGQRGVVAIGNLRGSKFSVVWVGMLEVQ